MFLHGNRNRERDSDSDSDSDVSPSPDPDVLGKLLSHQAARRVEELRLAAGAKVSEYWSSRKEDQNIPLYEEAMFTLCLGSLLVLELTACNLLVPLPPASAVVFLRLSSLRLRRCTARIDALQSLVDAAPALAAIHLESVTITQQRHGESFSDYYIYDDTGPPPSTETVQLCCPAATVLVLDRCHWKVKVRPWPHQDTEHVVLTVEINAPRLQAFRYKGILPPVSLSPPPPDLARADLHFIRRRKDKNVNEYFSDQRVTLPEILAMPCACDTRRNR
jgi:hypothetical protein